MKKSEIDDCLRLYRRSIDAYRELSDKLKESQAAADGLPILGRAKRLLEEAMGHLDRLGEGISVLPELAERLIEEKRTCALLKDQAARAGLVFHLDAEDLAAGPEGDREDEGLG